MGFFSWLLGMPAKKPAARKSPAQSREELIANALRIRAEKKKEFDKLDPEVRARLLRQAMGKPEPDDEAP